MDDDPLCCALCLGQGRSVAGGGIVIAERGDHPSVFAGVDVLVDAGDALGAAGVIVEFEVGGVFFTVVQIGVLGDVEDACLRCAEEAGGVAIDGLGRGEVFVVLRLCVGERVL